MSSPAVYRYAPLASDVTFPCYIVRWSHGRGGANWQENEFHIYYYESLHGEPQIFHFFSSLPTLEADDEAYKYALHLAQKHS